MKIGFIGDIVGKPGRLGVKRHLKRLKSQYELDFVIGNYENASHGFGLSEKNCKELLSYGIDMMSGGNHSFDKKEIVNMFDKYPLIRPINYPRDSVGEGLYTTEVDGKRLAVINIMGHYTMPLVDNPFTMIVDEVAKLKEQGFNHIVIDIHAEASAEKNAMLHIVGEDVSAILGTHTHVATDDLQIQNGCCYVSDVGLSGCIDGVIGMKKEIPISRFLQGFSKHHDIDDRCKSIFQMIIFELNDDGRCVDAFRVKSIDNAPYILTPMFRV